MRFQEIQCASMIGVSGTIEDWVSTRTLGSTRDALGDTGPKSTCKPKHEKAQSTSWLIGSLCI